MPFIGSIILEFIGASIRWIFLLIKSRMTGKKVISFKEIFDGKKRSSFKESVEHGMSNIILGFVVIFIVCMILMELVG